MGTQDQEWFEEEAREAFSMLERDFRFSLVKSERFGFHDAVLTYMNSTTGVEVMYEEREKLISVLVARLAPLSLRPWRWLRSRWPFREEFLSVQKLVAHAGGPDVPRRVDINRESIREVVRANAAALVTYASDPLRGEFGEFDRLAEEQRRYLATRATPI